MFLLRIFAMKIFYSFHFFIFSLFILPVLFVLLSYVIQERYSVGAGNKVITPFLARCLICGQQMC